MAKRQSINMTDNMLYSGQSVRGTEEADDIMIENSRITESPFNKDLSLEGIEELAASMKENGLLQPVIVFDRGDGSYELISGHRRKKAWCEILGNSTIRAIVRPYDPDIRKRFRMHTEANSKTREKDLGFWLSRIEMAKSVLKEENAVFTRQEELKQLSDLLGLSTQQLYRYEGFSKLSSDLQNMIKAGWASVTTVYAAVSLNKEQQESVVKRIKALKEQFDVSNRGSEDAVFEITRNEFEKIVRDVKAGAGPAKNKGKSKEYAVRSLQAKNQFLKLLKSPKTEEDRVQAIRVIEELKQDLEKLEKQLKKDGRSSEN